MNSDVCQETEPVKSVSKDALNIGGFTPMTTIDYPRHLAAVVFLQGCPWRCRYCQNTHLIPRRAREARDWLEILEFLERRRGLLDAVMFSGGEPTLQKGLVDAAKDVKEMGFKAGLHTAGIYPRQLAAALPYLDWVGIDIKTATQSYPGLTDGGSGSGRLAWHSLDMVMDSGVDYEVRTTVHPDLMGRDELLELARELARKGVGDYVAQRCVAGRCLDESLSVPSRADFLDDAFQEEVGRLFKNFSIRG